MTAAIFFVSALSLWSAAAGRRDMAVTFFGIALLVSIMWLEHHMTAPLNISL